MIRVVLVDDEAKVRRGIRLMLETEPDIDVVGETGDACEAPAFAANASADVVVLDIEMPLLDGIALAGRFREAAPGIPVVILSLHDDDRTQARAFAAGATAFVSKTSADGVLVQSIRRAAASAPGNQGEPE